MGANAFEAASVALDSTGGAVAAWREGPLGRVVYALRAAGGGFGRPRNAGPPPPSDRATDVRPFVAAGAGRFVVAWYAYVPRVGPGGERLRGLMQVARVRVGSLATGRLGPPVTLGESLTDFIVAGSRPVAIEETGAVRVLWWRVASSPGRAWEAVMSVLGPGQRSFQTVRLPDPVSRPDAYHDSTVLVSAPGGRLAALLFRAQLDGDFPDPALPPALSRLAPAGFPPPAFAPAANPGQSTSASAAFGKGDEILVAWIDRPRRVITYDDQVGPLRVAVLNAEGSFTNIRLLSSGHARRPTAARLDDGRVLTLWSTGSRYQAALSDRAGRLAPTAVPRGRPFHREFVTAGRYAALIGQRRDRVVASVRRF